MKEIKDNIYKKFGEDKVYDVSEEDFTPDSLGNTTRVVRVQFKTLQIKRLIQYDFPMKVGQDHVCYTPKDYLFRELFKSKSNTKKKFLKKNSMIIVMTNVEPYFYNQADMIVKELTTDENQHLNFVNCDSEIKMPKNVSQGERKSYIRVRSLQKPFQIQVFDFKDEKELYITLGGH